MIKILSAAQASLIPTQVASACKVILSPRSDVGELGKAMTRVGQWREKQAAIAMKCATRDPVRARNIDKSIALIDRVLIAGDARAVRLRSALDEILPKVRRWRSLLEEAHSEIFKEAASLRESCSLRGKIVDTGLGEAEEVARLEDLTRRIGVASKE